MPKDDEILASLVRKFMTFAHSEGILDQLYLKYLGLDARELYTLMGAEPGAELFMLPLNLDEARRVAEIQGNGQLRIATILSPDNYFVQDDGTIVGFDYHLAAGLARMLGVELDVTVVESEEKFFAREGVFDPAVVDDESMVYTPDIATEVDLYASLFYVTDWRKRLVSMVDLAPVGMAIIGRDVAEVESMTELDGWTAAVGLNSHQHLTLQAIEEEHGISFVCRGVPTEDSSIDVVRRGDADFTIDGATFVAAGIDTLGELEIAPQIVSPGKVGWALRKDDEALVGILQKYVQYSLGNGELGRLWEENLGIDFQVYVEILMSVFQGDGAP